MKAGERIQIGCGETGQLGEDAARLRSFERERRLRLREALDGDVLRGDVAVEGLAKGLARSRSIWRRKQSSLLNATRSETSFPLFVRKAAGMPLPGASERTSLVRMFWRNDSRSFPRTARTAR
jgi:hypothetical protein